MTKRIAVALSGGVDSSVTAFLLKESGYDVIGITAKTSNSPEANLIVNNAKLTADKLEIPFYELDVSEVFQKNVIDYFEQTYAEGKTPNPCIMCNKYMKWGVLFDFAINNLNADSIATGHYAKIKIDSGVFKLYPAMDEEKDQLYFLFTLGQNQLAKTLFPLADLKKSYVKHIAIENNLPCKSSKESQDICFIRPPLTTKKYLNNLFKEKQGVFIEKSTGKILGKHNGFWQYTIGQRKGIGLAAPEALYVIDIDAENNIVYVGYHDMLFSDKILIKNMYFSYAVEKKNFNALVKIRYNMKPVLAAVSISENNIAKIHFNEPVSAVAKGQACVLYDENDGHLIGGGFI